MITALVGRKRRLLFITPASVKQWQLPVIMQKRNWGKPAKNKTLLPPPFPVQHPIYYPVPAITKGCCWSRFAGDIQRLGSVTWQFSLCLSVSLLTRITHVISERHPKMTSQLARRDRLAHLAKSPPAGIFFKDGKSWQSAEWLLRTPPASQTW